MTVMGATAQMLKDLSAVRTGLSEARVIKSEYAAARIMAHLHPTFGKEVFKVDREVAKGIIAKLKDYEHRRYKDSRRRKVRIFNDSEILLAKAMVNALSLVGVAPIPGKATTIDLRVDRSKAHTGPQVTTPAIHEVATLTLDALGLHLSTRDADVRWDVQTIGEPLYWLVAMIRPLLKDWPLEDDG